MTYYHFYLQPSQFTVVPLLTCTLDTALLHKDTVAGGSRFLRSVDTYLPDYTASDPTRTVVFVLTSNAGYCRGIN